MLLQPSSWFHTPDFRAELFYLRPHGAQEESECLAPTGLSGVESGQAGCSLLTRLGTGDRTQISELRPGTCLGPNPTRHLLGDPQQSAPFLVPQLLHLELWRVGVGPGGMLGEILSRAE